MRKISRDRKTLDLSLTAIILIAVFALVVPVSASQRSVQRGQWLPSPGAEAYDFHGPQTHHGRLKPGVTVRKDITSETGYTATFVYRNASADTVVFSGNFFFAKPFEDDPARIVAYDPDEWTKEMFWYKPLFGAPYIQEMHRINNSDYWITSMELPCGNFLYKFIVDGVEKTDPVNPPIVTQYGDTSPLWSTAYVPFDKNKQLYDMSFALPRHGRKTGTVLSATYSIKGLLGEENDTQGLCIYLPFGYDANRRKPYPVLYLSHGILGNEAHWFSLANAENIMDNLIAHRKIEPTIFVTMNNQIFAHPEPGDWNFEAIIQNQMDNIIPYMEENYNVSTDPEDRAYAGLSMGGMTTSHMLMRQPDDFGYFGIFSGADAGNPGLDGCDVEAMRRSKIFLGMGIYDPAYYAYSTLEPPFEPISIPAFQDVLSRNFVPYDYLLVNGGHDWSTWRQLLYKFVKDILWK